MESGHVYIATNVFETLLALSFEDQQQGLMYIKPPVPNMAFVYNKPQVNKFWMANTPAPLDIIFCHAGEVVQICEGKPYSTTVLGDDRLSDLIIELPYGTAASSGIKLGHKAGLIKNPSIEQLKQALVRKFTIT